MLACVACKILGQYDSFAASEQSCLLLVYSNVIAVERQLRVEPSDFRLWVCLHEVIHWIQFTANRWLSDYMSKELVLLNQETSEDIGQVVGRIAYFVRSRCNGSSAAENSTAHVSGILGLVRTVQSELHRVALHQLLMLGNLLESLADHVMDAVGPMTVPSVATIRHRFDDRSHRKQPSLQRLLRALLGVDAKPRRYKHGKAFVDHVVDRIGMARFNVIWSGPETLPLSAEVEDPQRWIDRVL